MKKVVLAVAAVLVSLGISFAQDNNDNNEASHNVGITIPTVALLDVEDADGEAVTINLTPDVSALEAGDAIDFSTATDNSLWLNYTSVVEAGNGNGNNPNERVITVEIDDESELPGGVTILLSASSASSGNGNKGEAVSGNLTLSQTAQNLITGIGTCYTESGDQKGHQLTYTLNMNNADYADLFAENYEVQVTYTISED